MAFRPTPDDKLIIHHDRTVRIAEHPAEPGGAYGQSGRRGTVYQLIDEGGQTRALKVFLPQFREPRLARHAERIRPYVKHKGLRVCEREVLTASHYVDLLHDHMELAAVAQMGRVDIFGWSFLCLSC